MDVVDRMNGLLAFIANFKSEHGGNSPTVREMQDGCNYSSTSMVHRDLEHLEAYGAIERQKGIAPIARSVMLPGGEYTPPDNNHIEKGEYNEWSKG